MRYILFILSIMMLIGISLIIIAGFTGRYRITHRDFFLFAFAYLLFLVWYLDRDKKKREKQP